MPGTTSTALPYFSHDQHHETDAAKRKGGLMYLTPWLKGLAVPSDFMYLNYTPYLI